MVLQRQEVVPQEVAWPRSSVALRKFSTIPPKYSDWQQLANFTVAVEVLELQAVRQVVQTLRARVARAALAASPLFLVAQRTEL